MQEIFQKIARCPECKRLERKYDETVDKIYLVVNTRSQTVRDKIRWLHEAQDIRDQAWREWNKHKESHRAKPVAEIETSLAASASDVLRSSIPGNEEIVHDIPDDGKIVSRRAPHRVDSAEFQLSFSVRRW